MRLLNITIKTLLVLSLPCLIRAQVPPPLDFEAAKALAETVIKELNDQQFDLLESQYRDFKDQTQPDGTPREWIFFSAFERATQHDTFNLEQADLVVQKAAQWLETRPDSIPAVLALDETLIGECKQIRDHNKAIHTDPSTPESAQLLQPRVDRINQVMLNFPGRAVAALQAEPQYYATVAELMILLQNPFETIKQLDHDLQHYDPCYALFYINTVRWLFARRAHDPTLPRPEVWLTDHFKTTPLDSDEDRIRKCRTYTQALSFDLAKEDQLQLALLDWPTLKTGLQDLIKTYGPNTDWPTRYLAYAWTFKDKEAIKIIDGNYSPEIITEATAFQDLNKWAEEDP
jgi:hypothetical protein